MTPKDYYKVPAKASDGSFTAIVEIPAGTNKKYEYDPLLRKFVIDKVNNSDRIIDYLPYPGNYGFIPSTISKIDLGGDGDALDVLILSESLPTGTIIKVIPVALLKLIDRDEMDYKIIGVPLRAEKRIVNAVSYNSLLDKYPSLLKIIELWFCHYDKNDQTRIEGWGDEKEAYQEIQRHLKKQL